MLKLFSLCSGSEKYKIQPGQVGIDAYQVKTVKKRDILAFFEENSESPSKSKSLKDIVENDSTTQPIQSFKSDPSKFTESTGDSSTFLRIVHKSNFQQLRDNLRNKKQKYTDPVFPPTSFSLGKDPHFEKTVKKWVRLSELYQNPVFFSNDVDPSDVLQGYLTGSGNCYLMSAIANLAKTPNRIKQIFGNTEVSKEGIYYVNLFNKGAFKEVIIDDFVPVSATGPVFARPPPGSGQIWVQLLEKSYAKLFGSYKSMSGMDIILSSGGLPSEAYYALTGAPTFFYSLTESKEFLEKYWTVVMEAHSRNFCVDFGTPQKVDPLKWLKENHAYTMLAAYEIQGNKLIKLRNPMGKLQWIGRGSDYDVEFWNSITPENQKLIGYEPGKISNGIFFMLWQDVFTYFMMFEVCEYKQNANVLSIRMPFTMKTANMFEIETQGGQLVVSLIEDSQRGTDVDLSTFTYSKSYFFIAKFVKNSKGETSYKIIRIAAKNQFAAHHQRLKLDPGTYVVYTKYRWNDNIDKNASFVVYSQNLVRIREVKQSEHPQLFQKTYLSIANQIPEFTDPKEKYTYLKRFYGQSGGFGFYAVKAKRDNKQTIEVQIDEQEMKQNHLKLKKPYKNKGKFKIILKAAQSIIIPFWNKDVIIPQKFKVPDLKITIKP